jgi:hypothetical protein
MERPYTVIPFINDEGQDAMPDEVSLETPTFHTLTISQLNLPLLLNVVTINQLTDVQLDSYLILYQIACPPNTPRDVKITKLRAFVGCTVVNA